MWGVMEYYGGSGDRRRADEIHARYVEGMKRFVRWLVDSGRSVRLFAGDDVDNVVARKSWPTCGHTGPTWSQRGPSPNPSSPWRS